MHSNGPIFPAPVNPGDCIGLFSPSGPVRDRERYEAGLQLLHGLGFRTKQYESPSAGHEYLAADDPARAEEFRTMWQDPEVHALLAVRGGYGCLRMMPHLDLDMLRDNPKPVIGFSDLTILLNTLAERSGIVTYHGPVLTSLAASDQASIHSFISTIAGAAGTEITIDSIKVLRGGSAAGLLRGGNLTTIAHLLGTPWEIPCQGSILLLEDTAEPLYKIDRILTQLYVSGRLNGLAGILLGTFDCGSDPQENRRLQEGIWKRVLELTAQFDYPVWGGFPAGHKQHNHTFPLGAKTSLDSGNKIISFSRR